MGKYDIATGLGTARDLLLEVIANELAEANRLKRLEIRVQLTQTDLVMDLRKGFLNELEDQA